MSVAAIVLSFTGCRTNQQHQTICAIPQLASQEPYLTERAGMDEIAAKGNILIDWEGPSDPDPQRQIDIIAAATEADRYGIAINPVSPNTMDSAIEAALARGIPVAVLRDPVELQPQPHLSFLLEDYSADAELISHRLQQVIPSGGEIAIVGVDPYAPSSVARLDETEKALRVDCPGIHVIDRVIAPYSAGLVQIAAEKVLDEHPHLVAFIALNNRAGFGAAAAIATKHPAHPVRVLVFDQSLPLLLRLRRGQIDSVVAQDMRKMGQLAVMNIEADRAGRPYDHLRHLQPMLVTLDNVDEEKTQEALLLNWEKP